MVDAMTYPNPNYHGPCPYCGSAISVVIKDGTTVARCSHRGCGARGPIMRSTERAVELFRAGRCVKVGSGADEAIGGVCEECDDGYVIVTVGAGEWQVPIECPACNGTGRSGGPNA